MYKAVSAITVTSTYSDLLVVIPGFIDIDVTNNGLYSKLYRHVEWNKCRIRDVWAVFERVQCTM